MVEMRATRNNQNIENRVMINLLTAPTPALLEDVAIACWNWWENIYSVLLSTTVTLREVVATDLSVDTGDQFTYAPDTTTAGQVAGSALPNESAFCVSLRTGSRGRSARGRFYTLSVVHAQMFDDNFLTPAAAAAYVAAVQGLITVISDAGWQLTIVSYRHNNAPRVGGPVYFPVSTASAVDNCVDSMRRRKPGVGT
jgi:hypothetical protein